MVFHPSQDARLTVLADWDMDGSYQNALGNLTQFIREMRWNVGFRNTDRNLADEAKLEIVLNNIDGEFSPENPASPLYGLAPMTIKIIVQATAGQTLYTLWTGFIDEIRPTPGLYAERTAVIQASDARRFLQRSTAYLPLLRGVTTDQAIAQLLEQVGIPIPGTYAALDVDGVAELDAIYLAPTGITAALDAGLTTLNYVGDTWDDGVNVMKAIADLVNAERGKFFIGRNGTVIFWNRHYAGANSLRGWNIRDGWQSLAYRFGSTIANTISGTYKPRKIGTAPELLWQLDKPVKVGAGENRSIRANFSSQGGEEKISALDILIPESANGTLQMGSLEMVKFKPSAKGVEMEFANNSSAEGEVTVVQIYGTKLTAWNDVTIEETDGISVYHYGDQRYKVELGLLDNDSQARDILQYELMKRKDPQGAIESLTMAAHTLDSTQKIIQAEIGTRITVIDPQTKHSGEYIIIGEQHALRDGLSQWTVVWTLEGVNALKMATLDDATMGKLDGTGGLGY